MDFLKDRRTVLALAGAAVALLAGLGVAWSLVGRHRGETAPPPPASQGGLVIDTAGVDSHGDPAKALRCFVGGQPVGEMTLAECAKRNGVATDALDVGLDQSGQLAAAGQAGAMITPLPPASAKVPEVAAPEPQQGAAPLPAPLAVSGPPATCLRYGEGQWRRLPADMALGSCVQALFAGRCERPGGATYGRWGQQTLRLVPGKVEISADNHSFRPLMDQPGCPPAVG